MSRESQAVYDPPAGRADPVSLLERQATTRLPDLVPVWYGRMLASPFSYFRGAARRWQWPPTWPQLRCRAWPCRPAATPHLANFGLYASPERALGFDLNDFDETLPGPWEWDVKRLAASLEVAERENGYRRGKRRKIVTAAVCRYREAMRGFAGQANLAVWYARADVAELREQFGAQLSAQARKKADRVTAKARTRDSMPRARQADPPGGRHAADRGRPAAGGAG